MSEGTEAELVDKLKSGSVRAYQRLLDLHLQSVNRYVIRMMGNPSDAEDITQEVFIRLWQKSDLFNPKAARLTTWLHQIAHNLCLDHFRKHSRDTEEFNHEKSGGTEPLGVLVNDRTAQSINDAMSCLPERQRSAIVMCHYQGLSNKEAAEIHGVSVDALESLLSRGRKNLRGLLNGISHEY